MFLLVRLARSAEDDAAGRAAAIRTGRTYHRSGSLRGASDDPAVPGTDDGAASASVRPATRSDFRGWTILMSARRVGERSSASKSPPRSTPSSRSRCPAQASARRASTSTAPRRGSTSGAIRASRTTVGCHRPATPRDTQPPSHSRRGRPAPWPRGRSSSPAAPRWPLTEALSRRFPQMPGRRRSPPGVALSASPLSR